MQGSGVVCVEKIVTGVYRSALRLHGLFIPLMQQSEGKETF
jgi:hypothetical protein